MTDVSSGSGTPPIDKYDLHITQDRDEQVGNIDAMVQLVFIQAYQLSNLMTQNKLDETKDSLAILDKAREMYSDMKKLKKDAPNCTNQASEMPPDMIKFLHDNGIKTIGGNDDYYCQDEWDVNMSYLDSFTQKISGQNKTQMLELNQCVENGNNDLREVSTIFSKFSELVQSIIQTINR